MIVHGWQKYQSAQQQTQTPNPSPEHLPAGGEARGHGGARHDQQETGDDLNGRGIVVHHDIESDPRNRCRTAHNDGPI